MQRSATGGPAGLLATRPGPSSDVDDVTGTGPGTSGSHEPLVAGLPWLRLTWVSVVLALLVAADQVSRLAANVLDAQGNAWSLAELTGPTAWVSRAGWVADFGGDELRRSCLTAYVVLDLVLAALYAVAALWWARRRFLGPGRRLVVGAVLGATGLEVLEDVLALVAGHRRVVGTGLADTLARLSTVTWGLGLLVAAVLAWGWLTRRRGSVARQAGRAYETAAPAPALRDPRRGPRAALRRAGRRHPRPGPRRRPSLGRRARGTSSSRAASASSPCSSWRRPCSCSAARGPRSPAGASTTGRPRRRPAAAVGPACGSSCPRRSCWSLSGCGSRGPTSGGTGSSGSARCRCSSGRPPSRCATWPGAGGSGTAPRCGGTGRRRRGRSPSCSGCSSSATRSRWASSCSGRWARSAP